MPLLGIHNSETWPWVLAFAWFGSGYVAALAAEGKQHPFGRWFLIGLLLGPLAAFWAVFRLQKYVAPTERRACPHCGKTISIKWDRCPNCKEWVAIAGQVDRAAQAGYVAARLWGRFQSARKRAILPKIPSARPAGARPDTSAGPASDQPPPS